MLSYSPFVPDIFRARAPRRRSAKKLGTLWNPGNLGFQVLGLKRGRKLPLVVVLHGCGQEALGYARAAGWTDAAKRHGFALLLVEQRAINNPDLCFNWFNPLHIQRHLGEAASIAAAVGDLVRSGSVEPERIYVTGLSAGGAMASVMLATYPELFAGGAIIAGVPYGCANWVTSARECMTGSARIPSSELAGFVLRASDHRGPWPRVSVWHGTEDGRVVPSNGSDIVKQWLSVHRVRAKPHRVETVAGYPHQVWLDRKGKPVVERYEMTGLGHGTPVETRRPLLAGAATQNILAAAISSTDRIADFFGLAGPAPSKSASLRL